MKAACIALALAATTASALTCNRGHYINTDPRALFAVDGKTVSVMQKCDLNRTGDHHGGDGSSFVSCQCRRCPANYVSPGGDNVTSCSECPDEYRPNAAQDNCVPCTWRTCPAGTYNSVHTYNSHSFCGAQQCRPCPAGTYQPTSHVGTTACQACPANTNGSPGVQTSAGTSCDTIAPGSASSHDPIDHTHGGQHPTGYKCEHMKCFIELGRHGEIVLRSHHHRLEFPQANWTTVAKKHHCKVYHPADLRPPYCACTCFDESPVAPVNDFPHNVPNANISNWVDGLWPERTPVTSGDGTCTDAYKNEVCHSGCNSIADVAKPECKDCLKCGLAPCFDKCYPPHCYSAKDAHRAECHECAVCMNYVGMSS